MSEKQKKKKAKKEKKSPTTKKEDSKKEAATSTKDEKSSSSKRIALVTGGNRGIGVEIVNGLSKDKNNLVIFTCRKADEGAAALAEFKKAGRTNVLFRPLDLDDDKSVDALITNILQEFKYVDWLVNNAGVLVDSKPASSTNIADVSRVFHVNTLGPLRLILGFLPAMKERNYGRIVNMSSGMGQLSDMNGGYVAYRVSKAGLNVLTRAFADEVKDKNILINSMCPGFVKTDMTGGENSKATKTPEQGADTAVWLATLENDGPRNGFFRDRKPIPW